MIAVMSTYGGDKCTSCGQTARWAAEIESDIAALRVIVLLCGPCREELCQKLA